jgi:hypothetical protein
VHLNFFPIPIVHIDHETTRRFRLRLWMPSIITVLGGRVRFANISPNLDQKTPPFHSPLLDTIISRIKGTPQSGTSDGAAVTASTAATGIPTYDVERSFVTDFINFARQQKLYVCWIGIQETVKPQCEPYPSCDCTTLPPEPEPKVQKPPRRRKPSRPISVSREQAIQFLKFEGKK